MKRKKLVAMALTGVLCVGMLGVAGCSGKEAAKDSSSASTGSSTAEGGTTGEKETIEFWYHDGNTTSNPIFEELIKRFEEKYPQYEVNYVGLPSDSYLQKYNTAVATNTVPDVISIRDMDVSSFVSQEALMSMDEVYENFSEKDHLNTAVIDAVRTCAADGKLYCMPQYITTDISWCNTKLMEEKGVSVPATLDEFLEDCEKYADSANGTYFYSLRGGAGSMENMFDFIFTYADQNSLFDEEGNCVLDQPVFAEALDLYAGIYWNGWTSQDSVTNGFKEMVAEFGSQTSMYMSHNSSSLAEHKKNLGEGNFANVIAPANSKGNVVTKDLSFIGYAIMEGAEHKEGAQAFIEYLVSCEGASYLCEQEGRVPINDLIYEEEWYKNDEYNKVYQEMLSADNVKFLPHAIWLTEWNEFRSNYQEPGFQAVLMKERTSEEVLKEWADYLTTAQKVYLAAQ